MLPLLLLLLGASETPHVGSPIVFVRYKAPVAGTLRAGLIAKGPFECPPGTPHEGEECANIVFFTDGEPGDVDNAFQVVCAPDQSCMVNPANLVVFDGMERRRNVLHDPTGETERSWRVWGEAPGDALTKPPD